MSINYQMIGNGFAKYGLRQVFSLAQTILFPFEYVDLAKKK